MYTSIVNESKIKTKEYLDSKPKVDYIISTLSKEDKSLLGFTKNDHVYHDEKVDKYLYKRFLIEEDGIPVAFFDILSDGNTGTVAFAVNSKYRNMGYGDKITKIGSEWIDRNINYFDNFAWAVKENNNASIALAKKNHWHRVKSRDYNNSDDVHFIVFCKSKHFKS